MHFLGTSYIDYVRTFELIFCLVIDLLKIPTSS